MLESGAGLFAAAAVPVRLQGGQREQAEAAAADLTGRVARYMAGARQQPLPADELRETKHRVLDTVAAMVSGARLKPGEMAIRFARAQGGTPEAAVLTTNIRTSAINAALVNAMFAHADETDDFEPVTKAHPGCAAVPAALAVGERENASGQEFVRAVALGYDLCCRWLQALGPNMCAPRIAAPRASARRWAQPRRRRRWRNSTRRGCATRCRTPSSRCPASGAGSAMSSTSRRHSTSRAWARATVSPRQ
jgi:hypothetical protein